MGARGLTAEAAYRRWGLPPRPENGRILHCDQRPFKSRAGDPFGKGGRPFKTIVAKLPQPVSAHRWIGTVHLRAHI